jgi:hypothetical protein
MASAVLLGLAHGKYDGQSEVTGKLLSELGIVLPPAVEAGQTIEVFLFLSRLVDPAAATLENNSSFVPNAGSLSGSKTEDLVCLG